MPTGKSVEVGFEYGLALKEQLVVLVEDHGFRKNRDCLLTGFVRASGTEKSSRSRKRHF
jgi:hypothetical protein